MLYEQHETLKQYKNAARITQRFYSLDSVFTQELLQYLNLFHRVLLDFGEADSQHTVL